MNENVKDSSYADILLGLAIIEKSIDENEPDKEKALRYYQRILLNDIKDSGIGGIDNVATI